MNCHCLIFNRARGCMMAVAETASSRGKSSCSGKTNGSYPSNPLFAGVSIVKFAIDSGVNKYTSATTNSSFTSTYNASSKSAGGSLSLNLTTGAVGGSVTAGSTKVNSNFTSVNQQTGTLAGDGGFTVTVAGNTTLTGGVISSTHKAVDLNLNSFTNGTKNPDGSFQAGTGNLTITDLANSASYNASGSSFSAGITLGPDGKGASKASRPTS